MNNAPSFYILRKEADIRWLLICAGVLCSQKDYEQAEPLFVF